MNLKGLFLSKRSDWRTPKVLLQELQREFGVLWDPCPTNADFNGLQVEWHQNTFVNPPYSRETIKWCRKAVQEYKKGKTVIMLLAARTDTKWFHDYILPHAKEVRFIRGRLKFDDRGPAPFPSMIVVLKENERSNRESD